MVKLAWMVLAYLMGSIPFGLFIAQAVSGSDPRTAGSGNIGATNVARLCGTKWGTITLLLDAFKGFFPVVVARAMYPDAPWFAGLTAMAAIGGHLFPVFLNYKGGKGVATTIGAFLGLAFWSTAVSGILCAAAIAATGFVSVGSLVWCVTLPFTVYFFSAPILVPMTVVVSAVVIWKHKENIARLRAGEEKPWRDKGCSSWCCFGKK